MISITSHKSEDHYCICLGKSVRMQATAKPTTSEEFKHVAHILVLKPHCTDADMRADRCRVR